MDTEKKRKQIIGTMKECFEQLGFPDLRYGNAIAHPNADEENVGHIVPSAIRFSYQEDYYSRALIDMVIHDKIPDEKVASFRELINLINMDLAFDHFCLIPDCNTLVFRASLFVPGDQLPRNKFKKILTQYLADYIRCLPIIEKLLIEEGNPYELFQSLAGYRSAGPKEKSQRDMADYEKLRQGIKRVFAKVDLPVKDEMITDSSVHVMSRFRTTKCRIEVTAFALNYTGQLYLQMFNPDALPGNMISEAVELANMFNSTSYVNHIFILHRHNIVSLLTGVILDPDLDEVELEYQLKILFSEGCKYLPVFLGNQSANTSQKEQMKAILDGCCAKVIY